MAIQGYTPSSQRVINELRSIYGPNANNTILSNMLAIFGQGPGGPISNEQAQAYMSDIIARARKSGYPVLVDEDGKLDLGLIYPTGEIPSIWEEIDIIGEPDGTFWAMILNGRWTVIANQDAFINLMLQVAQNMPTEIEPPEIEFISQYGFGVGMDWRTGATVTATVISFCATFYTKYGETTPSNVLMSPITGEAGWNVQIGLRKDPHSLVKAIYFYRTFGTQFRRVKTVVVNE